jgi:hypothetical protein
MADIEELKCGCVITPYEIHRKPGCKENHDERQESLYLWRKRKMGM